MTRTKEEYHSNKWPQAKLLALGYDIIDNFERVVQYFNLDLYRTNRMYVGCCPVHGGDNGSALNVFHDGHSNRGNWLCNTRQCQEVFCNSPIGFIRGVLSHCEYNWETKGDDTVSFGEAVEWCSAFVNKKNYDIDTSDEQEERRRFISRLATKKRQSEVVDSGPSREEVRNSGIRIPSPYYLNLDPPYSEEVLEKYDVGYCADPTKPFYTRTVVPVYDEWHSYMVGCSGRSTNPECEKCKGYHNPSGECKRYPKWKHSETLKTDNHLYNLWYAKRHIKKSGLVVVVESPGNVWRLEEAGVHNSVAVFGSSLKDGQKILLDKSGALCILVIGDNDEGGRTLIEDVKTKCGNIYNIIGATPDGNDIGKLSAPDLRAFVDPYLSQLDIYGAYLYD